MAPVPGPARSPRWRGLRRRGTPRWPVYSTVTGARRQPAMRSTPPTSAATCARPVRSRRPSTPWPTTVFDVFLEIGPHPGARRRRSPIRWPRKAGVVTSLAVAAPRQTRARDAAAGCAAAYAAGAELDWDALQGRGRGGLAAGLSVAAPAPLDPTTPGRSGFKARCRRACAAGHEAAAGRRRTRRVRGRHVIVDRADRMAGRPPHLRPAADARGGPDRGLGQRCDAGASAATPSPSKTSRSNVHSRCRKTRPLRPRVGRRTVRRHNASHWYVELHTSDGRGWQRVASATARLAPADAPASQPAARSVNPLAIDHQAFYDAFAALGVAFGPRLRTLRDLTVGDDRAAAATETQEPPTGPWAHAAQIDAALQLCSAAAPADAQGQRPARVMLPVAAQSITLRRCAASHLRAEARVAQDHDRLSADVWLRTDEGSEVVSMQGVRFVRADAAAPASMRNRDRDVYVEVWEQAAPHRLAPQRPHRPACGSWWPTVPAPPLPWRPR